MARKSDARSEKMVFFSSGERKLVRVHRGKRDRTSSRAKNEGFRREGGCEGLGERNPFLCHHGSDNHQLASPIRVTNMAATSTPPSP